MVLDDETEFSRSVKLEVVLRFLIQIEGDIFFSFETGQIV